MNLIPTCPPGSTTIYFAALDATPHQVSTPEKLAEYQQLVRHATDEHNCLLRYAQGLQRNAKAQDLLRNMAEIWGELASELAGRYHDLKAVQAEMAACNG